MTPKGLGIAFICTFWISVWCLIWAIANPRTSLGEIFSYAHFLKYWESLTTAALFFLSPLIFFLGGEGATLKAFRRTVSEFLFRNENVHGTTITFLLLTMGCSVTAAVFFNRTTEFEARYQNACVLMASGYDDFAINEQRSLSENATNKFERRRADFLAGMIDFHKERRSPRDDNHLVDLDHSYKRLTSFHATKTFEKYILALHKYHYYKRLSGTPGMGETEREQNYTDSLVALEEASELSQGDPSLAVIALKWEALEKSDAEDAFELYNSAIAIIENNAPELDYNLGHIYNRMAILSYYVPDVSNSFTYFESSGKSFSSLKPEYFARKHAATAYTNAAKILIDLYLQPGGVHPITQSEITVEDVDRLFSLALGSTNEGDNCELALTQLDSLIIFENNALIKSKLRTNPIYEESCREDFPLIIAGYLLYSELHSLLSTGEVEHWAPKDYVSAMQEAKNGNLISINLNTPSIQNPVVMSSNDQISTLGQYIEKIDEFNGNWDDGGFETLHNKLLELKSRLESNS